MYEIALRVTAEAISAIICFILLWFMIKPYRLTKEDRYLGLPLGFGFLGLSYILGTIAFSIPSYFFKGLDWLQLIARTLAFTFLAVTYYFSRKSLKNSRIIWDVTFSLIIVAITSLVAVGIILTGLSSQAYRTAEVYVRIFNIICLVYVSFHILRSHVEEPEPSTIWIPFGFIMLGISQYSLLIWAIDRSLSAFWGALLIRLAALVIFLSVSYTTFTKDHK
jgi:hypothetical protein